jgi:hypothetical protein
MTEQDALQKIQQFLAECLEAEERTRRSLEPMVMCLDNEIWRINTMELRRVWWKPWRKSLPDHQLHYLEGLQANRNRLLGETLRSKS